MQAFARLLGEFGKLFESDGGIDEIAKNETGSLWLTAQKQRCRFIEERDGKFLAFLEAQITAQPEQITTAIHNFQVAV